MKRTVCGVIIIGLMMLGGNSGWSSSSNEVISVGVERLAQEDLVSIKTAGGEVHYTYFKLKSSLPEEPDRIVVDIWGANRSQTPRLIPVGTEAIEQIRTGIFEENRVRIVLDLKGDYPFRVTKSGNDILVYVKNVLRTARPPKERTTEEETSVPISHEEMVRRYFMKGKELYIEGNYAEAKIEFQKVLTIEPSHMWAKRYIEEIEEEGRASRVEAQELLAEQISEVQTSREREFMQHYGAGKAYYDEKRYSEAIEEFNKADRVIPEHKFRNKVQSYVLRAQKNLQKDLRKSKREVKGARVRELISSGQSAYIAQDYLKAKKLWTVILELEPHNRFAPALIEKADRAILQGQKRTVDAQKRMEEKARLLDVERSFLNKPYLTKTPERPELDIFASKVAGIKRKEEVSRMLGEKAEQRVTLNFKEADIRDVIQQLHEWTGVNIVLDEAVFDEIEPTITIYLTDVSLMEALEYIIKSKGLAYRLEEGIIFVTTPDRLEAEGKMETRIYHLRKGLGTHTIFSEEAMFAKKPTEEKAVSRQEAIIRREITIKDLLEQSVSWPEGSRITLLERSGSVVITNTVGNLQIIEDILKEFDATPIQVMIEARFVEVRAGVLKELGVKWKLTTDWGIDRVSGKGNKLQIDKGQVSEFPKLSSHRFVKDLDGTNIDSLGSIDIKLGGILTYPQFEVVLHAIEQDEKTNLLSSPKVTTINGQSAVIKVVREYIYPTAYKTTAAEYNSAGVKVKDATSTPEKFVTRDAGILLKIVPRVGMDRKMINLTIIPEVSELGEWYDYGTEDTPYKQPFFDSRKCITSIVVNDGDTVVLGGLIRETTDHIRDKVPLLGDIPILGGLFRRDYDRVEKRNLLIFVTAHILNPSGEMDR